jgi:hypothetical protein
MLSCGGKFSIGCLRAQTTRTKTPVLAIIFRVPMTSVSPYLNPHISAESSLMKTTKQLYFILTLIKFIFRSQKYPWILITCEEIFITAQKLPCLPRRHPCEAMIRRRPGVELVGACKRATTTELDSNRNCTTSVKPIRSEKVSEKQTIAPRSPALRHVSLKGRPASILEYLLKNCSP